MANDPRFEAQLIEVIRRVLRPDTRTVSATGDIALGDDIILVDTTSGAVTLTLPKLDSAYGKIYHIKKTNAGANNLTVDGFSAETIDGATTLVWNTQYLTYTLFAGNSEWHIL